MAFYQEETTPWLREWFLKGGDLWISGALVFFFDNSDHFTSIDPPAVKLLMICSIILSFK